MWEKVKGANFTLLGGGGGGRKDGYFYYFTIFTIFRWLFSWIISSDVQNSCVQLSSAGCVNKKLKHCVWCKGIGNEKYYTQFRFILKFQPQWHMVLENRIIKLAVHASFWSLVIDFGGGCRLAGNYCTCRLTYNIILGFFFIWTHHLAWFNLPALIDQWESEWLSTDFVKYKVVKAFHNPTGVII